MIVYPKQHKTDMDKIDMIRTELKRRREDILSKVHHLPIHRIELLDALLSFLDTLTEEPDKGLEEAAEEYSKRVSDGHNYRDLTCGFIDGAEWQKGIDRSYFLKCYKQGKKDMKEQMLKDAVEGEVYKFGEVSYVKECNNAELTEYLSQFNNGDKVRIIIVKED